MYTIHIHRHDRHRLYKIFIEKWVQKLYSLRLISIKTHSNRRLSSLVNFMLKVGGFWIWLSGTTSGNTILWSPFVTEADSAFTPAFTFSGFNSSDECSFGTNGTFSQSLDFLLLKNTFLAIFATCLFIWCSYAAEWSFSGEKLPSEFWRKLSGDRRRVNWLTETASLASWAFPIYTEFTAEWRLFYVPEGGSIPPNNTFQVGDNKRTLEARMNEGFLEMYSCTLFSQVRAFITIVISIIYKLSTNLPKFDKNLIIFAFAWCIRFVEILKQKSVIYGIFQSRSERSL